MKTCLYCGKEFEGRSDKICCCDICYRSYYYLKRRAKHASIIYKVICKFCGKEFESARKDKIFCSKSCCSKLYKNKNMEKIKLMNKNWFENNKIERAQYDKERKTKKLYGMSIEDKFRLYISQNGLCKICNEHMDFTGKNGSCIDHDHKTGKIRGLLCGNCNKGIGNLKENIDILQRAIKYLEEQR